MWNSVDNGKTIGTVGSEDGKVMSDEEYKKRCRITLEKTDRYYAITCCVYGAMMHTAFANENNYKDKYESMKKDLQDFTDRETTEEEKEQFYEYFINKY